MNAGMLSSLGLGADTIMTPRVKKRVKAREKQSKRMETFYMGPGESLDSMRERVQKKLRDRFEKSVKGKKGADGKDLCCPSGYTWIQELAPGKAVYERDGKCYGCSWKNENGEVVLGPEYEVEKRVEYVGKE